MLMRHRRTWGVLAFGLVLLVTLGVASLAYSSGGPNAQLVPQDRVWGGGGTDPGCFEPFIDFCRTGSTNFAVDAHATGTGQAAYGDHIGGAGRSQVTCIAVHGHNAVVGGVSVTSPDPTRVGWLFATFYVDGGGPGSGLDLESPRWSGPPDPSGWPAGFPYVCPSADVGDPAFGLVRSFIPISRGDIVVQDGVSN